MSYEMRAEYRGESIGNDPQLEPCERETGFSFDDRDNWIRLRTYQSAIIRGLLDSEGVEIERIFLLNGVVVGLFAKFPKSMLSIKKPRAQQSTGRIVSGAIRTKGLVPKMTAKIRPELQKKRSLKGGDRTT
jgi:hypothetical protein